MNSKKEQISVRFYWKSIYFKLMYKLSEIKCVNTLTERKSHEITPNHADEKWFPLPRLFLHKLFLHSNRHFGTILFRMNIQFGSWWPSIKNVIETLQQSFIYFSVGLILTFFLSHKGKDNENFNVMHKYDLLRHETKIINKYFHKDINELLNIALFLCF